MDKYEGARVIGRRTHKRKRGNGEVRLYERESKGNRTNTQSVYESWGGSEEREETTMISEVDEYVSQQ